MSAIRDSLPDDPPWSWISIVVCHFGLNNSSAPFAIAVYNFCTQVVLKDRLRGVAMNAVNYIGGQKNINKMTWRLAEAVRDVQRAACKISAVFLC